MVKTHGLTHISLAVRDPERSLAFYAAVFGVREYFRDEQQIQVSRWSWSKFRKIDVSRNVLEMIDAIAKVFKNDKEILTVTRHDDYPF